MKQNKNKYLRDKAERIAKLECECVQGKDVKENQAKIHNIMSHLSFEEMMFIDDYIMKKKLVEKFLTK